VKTEFQTIKGGALNIKEEDKISGDNRRTVWGDQEDRKGSGTTQHDKNRNSRKVPGKWQAIKEIGFSAEQKEI